MSKRIGIFVGSLRVESFSRKLANIVIQLSPEGFDFEIVNIGDLPIYNQDFDDHNQVPGAYTTFREKVKSLDGVIFITPEYNRSVPAVLKNALDVASRPYGHNAWDGKPGLIMSCSPGNLSAFGANRHLRQSLVFLNVLVMQQPEVYLAHINEAFNEDGTLKSENTQEYLQKVIDAYAIWFNKLS